MKKIIHELAELFSFLLLMGIIGMAAILYGGYMLLYTAYAKITRQEHLLP
jgi:hypothetical protein